MATDNIYNTVDELYTGIRRIGSSKTQKDYEENYNLIFDHLDKLDDHLGKSRFLDGDKPGQTDEKLYLVLVSFDIAYYFIYRLNKKRIRDYENLWNYAKELYSFPEFKDNTDFEAIKKREFTGPDWDNPYNIIPLGPDYKNWNSANNRSILFGNLKIS